MERIEPAAPPQRHDRLDGEILGDLKPLAPRCPVEAANAVAVPAEQQRLMREIRPGRARIEAMRDIVDDLAAPLHLDRRKDQDQRRGPSRPERVARREQAEKLLPMRVALPRDQETPGLGVGGGWGPARRLERALPARHRAPARR